MQGSGDNSDGCFDTMNARSDAAEIGQRSYKSYGSVAAHTEICDVIEIDNSGCTLRINRLTEQCANDYVRSARLVDYSRSKIIVIALETLKTRRQWPRPQVGSAGKNEPGGFAFGMRV